MTYALCKGRVTIEANRFKLQGPEMAFKLSSPGHLSSQSLQKHSNFQLFSIKRTLNCMSLGFHKTQIYPCFLPGMKYKCHSFCKKQVFVYLMTTINKKRECCSWHRSDLSSRNMVFSSRHCDRPHFLTNMLSLALRYKNSSFYSFRNKCKLTRQCNVLCPIQAQLFYHDLHSNWL